MTFETRAVVITAPGATPVVETIDVSEPTHDEVAVSIAATGICHTDLAVSRGTLPTDYPVVLGHEAAGVVTAVGQNVTRFRPGDRVVVSTAHHCGHCRWCESGYPPLCIERFGHRPRLSRGGEPLAQGYGTGTFAALTVVRERSLAPVPDAVPLDVAALVGCAVVTGAGAVTNDAKVTPGATVVVLGCGGVGLSVIMAARLAGAARIVGVDPNRHRRREALLLGASEVSEPAREALLELEPIGYDFAFESSGVVAAMELALDVTGPTGTTSLLGLPAAEDRLRLPVQEFVNLNRRLLGVNMGRLRPHVDMPNLFRLYERGLLRLDLMSRAVFDLEDVAAAFDAARMGEVVRVQLTTSVGG